VPTTDLAAELRAACQLTGEFTLRSGLTSGEYFDKYRFEADPVLLRRVAEAMVPLVPPDTQLLAGPELGAIPLVTMLSAVTGLPARFVRKEPKTYGTAQQIEGGPVSGRRLTVVEDVVTRAGAVLQAVDALRSAGAEVTTVLCAIDREHDGRANLAAAGLDLRAVLTRTDLDRAS
jgi:orotate phosphoribosyltransferase